MQRLRTTFKRSRTPTGAEMKTQSSLEVPKQVRSASFDEMQLEAKRNQEALQQSDSLLKVPANSQRSKSMDATAEDLSANYLEVPRRYVRRRSSGDKVPIYCVHCQYIDDIAKFHQSISVEDESVDSNLSLESLSSLLGSSDSLYSSEEDKPEGELEENVEENESQVVQPCSIKVTLSPNSPSSPSMENISDEMASGDVMLYTNQGRRRSITSPKLSRQAAFVVVEKNSSLENVSDVASEGSDNDLSKHGVSIRTEGSDEDSNYFNFSCAGLTVDLKIDEPFDEIVIKEPKLGGSDGDVQQSTSFVKDIFLQVPELKRDRAASVDSCFTKVSQSGKAEEVGGDSLEVPGNVALRSRSVDIVLPTDEQARYKALAMAHVARAPVRGYVFFFNIFSLFFLTNGRNGSRK